MTRGLWEKPENTLRLCLGGDVMTGRAIDQLFATHNPDHFGKANHTPASQYLQWSAELHGAEMRPLRHDYIWGAALGGLDAAQPDFSLVNLETAITTSSAWEAKQYNFRMHPDNIGCLTAAGLNCVSLANNHVLDFGVDGLNETMATLERAGIGFCGAGATAELAGKPHIHALPNGKRLLVFAWGFRDSHIVFPHWAAGASKAGIQFVDTIDRDAATAMVESIAAYRQAGDLVIASLHWGANWVRAVPAHHRALARYLIDRGTVDLVHGHSSHHVLPVEVYRGRLIMYGCGDLINDTEGKPEYRARKGYLGALYFADVDARTHRLTGLRIQPLQRRRFRLESPSREDFGWVLARVQGRNHGGPRVASQ